MSVEIAAMAFAIVLASVGIVRLLPYYRRERVRRAQAKARRNAALGVTAARLRHPSVRAKENR